jgi:hypothetical protein
MQTTVAYGLEGRTCRKPAWQGRVKCHPVGTFAGAPPGYEDVLAPRPLQGPADRPGNHHVHVSLDRIAGIKGVTIAPNLRSEMNQHPF